MKGGSKLQNWKREGANIGVERKRVSQLARFSPGGGVGGLARKLVGQESVCGDGFYH